MRHVLCFLVLLMGTTLSVNAQRGCGNVGNVITQNPAGDVFTASSADAYQWEIVSGGANIIGGSNGQSASVICWGNNQPYRIKVTRTINGAANESCLTSTCYTSGGVDFVYEYNVDGNCTHGIATLGPLQNVNGISWSWALGSHSGSIASGGLTEPIYFPLGNWTNYYIVISAKVEFNNGTTQLFADRFLLDCISGPGGPSIRKPTPYPNPSEGGIYIENETKEELQKVVVRNVRGQTVKELTTGLNEKIDLTDQQEGIYFIEIHYGNGEVSHRRLSLNR